MRTLKNLAHSVYTGPSTVCALPALALGDVGRHFVTADHKGHVYRWIENFDGFQTDSLLLPDRDEVGSFNQPILKLKLQETDDCLWVALGGTEDGKKSSLQRLSFARRGAILGGAIHPEADVTAMHQLQPQVILAEVSSSVALPSLGAYPTHVRLLQIKSGNSQFLIHDWRTREIAQTFGYSGRNIETQGISMLTFQFV